MEIKSLLIANRGEIAIRIIRTAKKMGISSYVLKTSKEPNAWYLDEADHIIDFTECLSDTPEFLDIERIIHTIKENNIDAVHPGYGFLSENPIFAKRCEEEKITFIGPPSQVIHNMGNKTVAKDIARKNNIPLLRGSKGTLLNSGYASKMANIIGYPVILKAAAGGGGRGMRIVENENEIERLFNMASNESAKAFNDSSMFIEKYASKPRHIEFQILADKHGNVVHLGERECSIQRKHQKLLEESPSPALEPALREEMGEAAIKLAKAVGYFSAGTVEFLLDDDMNYYFMEMNTRIQVEHPVTEMVTGIDLIEQMIRIANGEKLAFKQNDINLKGHAIEFRINAEDVQSGFSPSLGTIEKISYPENEYTRVDTGVRDGSVITPYFDSMIAKLIIYGEDRAQTLNRSTNAIRKFWIKGTKTTLSFCRAVLQNRNFRNGQFNTGFLNEELEIHYHSDPEEEMLAAFFAAFDYAREIEESEGKKLNVEKGKNITPWLLNKRLR
ncbi:MAG TPA: biotin carboxylase N-terminal domain-containing protein [Bacteroidales bacterium]|nr:biotin carboxylase N-terminal domain-containing protein [Bacteroidales bacterium]